ncbi:FkbM family methyltransferase [Leptolyngbya boryana CZ1]|uniref:FkbM family methyltransferase n=1 Tax=Leptolyngbya boryana CZ1 TaxID=3060204 RepID=A0AA96WQY2_LEPBY|nr:FkbM family methyltransferase [Leptolyngbya boryana]WNZ43908.1 FkbM family methyltransferase [Leptolyngbya boryana CZ1]
MTILQNLREQQKQTKDFVGTVVNGTSIVPQGIIHVGGNIGEEAERYAQTGVDTVVWIEAVPESFQQLVENVRPYHQVCINALILDVDDQPTKFYKNRVGRRMDDHSYSSIYPINRAIETVFPHYRVVQTLEEIELTSLTLPTCLERHGLHKDRYDFLSLNTQGSELRIVQGMGEYLRQMKWVQSEVNPLNEISIYDGENTASELQAYMEQFGFERYKIQHSFGGIVLYLNQDLIDSTS